MKWNIELTFSKLLSFLMLLSATTIAIILKDPTPYAITIPIVGAIISNKQFQDRKNKECEKTTQ